MGVQNGKGLRGKIALVTGAGTGIGAAIARRFAAMGAETVICGRRKARLEQTAKQIRDQGGKVEVMTCDVSDWASVEALASALERKHGRLDVLVNNAGVRGPVGPLHELAPEQWEAILNTNLRGVYYCIRAFAPMMIRSKGGHIVNISSLAGKNPVPNGAAYSASKWGLNGLSYTVAEELRGHGIRVSVICPGSTESELSPQAGKDHSKMLQPDDVAHVAEMLVTQAPQSFASEVLLRPTMKP